jgi:hypothetical protein
MSQARQDNARFVDSALGLAHIQDPEPHRAYAARRLEDGAVKYGEDQYLDADCASEGREEGIDGANWLAFEWVKRQAADTLDESCRDLLRAAALYVEAAELVRGYLAERDG